MRDQLSAERRALPWVRIDKEYVFEGPDGRETLAELFEGRSQLVVYHFMFAPDWEAGCKSCSFWADNFNGIIAHLNQRDVTLRGRLARAPARSSRPLSGGWAGASSGCRPTAATSTTTFRSRSNPRMSARRGHLQLRRAERPRTDLPGISVFCQDAGGDRLPHLLVLRARPRHDEHRVSLPRPRAEGPRRGQAARADELAEAARFSIPLTALAVSVRAVALPKLPLGRGPARAGHVRPGWCSPRDCWRCWSRSVRCASSPTSRSSA